MRPQFLLIVGMVLMLGISLPQSASAAGSIPKLEIKKFRFSRHKKRNFERLVIEFAVKEHRGTAPEVKVMPNDGREANIIVDAYLVGAIPEALINDSYVPKSEFLGPVSINTDGPGAGFNIRAFMKDKVASDAFWMEKPSRLIIDAFPENSPRSSGREEPQYSQRNVASQPQAVEAQMPPIVCFPVTAQVSASVDFSPRGISSPDNVGYMTFAAKQQWPSGTPEPVVCYLASAQVVPAVTYKLKPAEHHGYYQFDPSFLQRMMQQQAPPPPPQPPPQNTSLLNLGQPPLLPPTPAPAVPPPMPPTAAPTAAPTAGTTLPTAPAATPVKVPPGVVVPDVPPGRTPLGSPLVNPATIQRLPTSSAAKLPTGYGDLAGGGFGAAMKPGSALPPPTK